MASPPSGGVRLSQLGRAVLGLATAWLALGAALGAPVVVATAGLLLAVLAAARVAHVGRIADVAGCGVELSLPAGPAVRRGQPLSVCLSLTRPRAGRPVWVRARLRTSAPSAPAPFDVLVPGGATGTIEREVLCPRAGHWRLHGVTLHLTGPLGLVEAWGYAPAEVPFTVRPAPVAPQRLRVFRGRIGAPGNQVGAHLSHRAGDGAELRELRAYVPGDPLRSIAWRATARRGRLLVRATEEETRRSIQIVLAIGPAMRAGAPGEAPLDQGVDLAAALLASLPGDRVGLTTFDTRVYGHLKPSAGGAARQRARRHLLDLSRVVDADLTEIARGDLALRVGRFLESQDRVVLRRTDVGRRAVARTLVDPLGELYDAGHLFAAVTAYLAKERTRGHAALFGKARPAEETFEARMRLFCALRGVALPYRLTGPADGFELGLRAAISQNLSPRSADELWVFADFTALTPDGPGLRAIAGAVARKKQVKLIPMAPLPAPARAALLRTRAQVLAGALLAS